MMNIWSDGMMARMESLDADNGDKVFSKHESEKWST